MSKNSFDKLKNYQLETYYFKKTISVLHWDKQVNMPKDGASSRAAQIAYLSGLAYERGISDEFKKLMDDISVDELNDKDSSDFNQLKHELEKDKKLDKDYVVRLNKAASQAYQDWLKARENNDFKLFQDSLQKLVELNREKAERYGYEDHPYSALCDTYEKGLTKSAIDEVFEPAKKILKDLLQQVSDMDLSSQKLPGEKLDKQAQIDFNEKIAQELGFTFDKGRLDFSVHPFTMSFNPNDVRITTRLKENDFSEALWSTIHEVGHGLYEQGLDVSRAGLPSGSAASLGIHESQSRLYENQVGKSIQFIEAYFDDLNEFFPNVFGNFTPKKLYRSINQIKPGLIRTNADEITYHFHIFIRYEIEHGIISGDLSVKDVPEIWKAKYQDYLGVEVPDDKNGCLQDIHWAHGAFGYFPTYTLGSFYAAQFFSKAEEEIPDLKKMITKKEFGALLEYLRKSIHRHGGQFLPNELCKRITGEELNAKYFNEYAREKIKSLA